MSCLSWQWHRSGYSWSSVWTLLVVPLLCDLGCSSRTVVVIKAVVDTCLMQAPFFGVSFANLCCLPIVWILFEYLNGKVMCMWLWYLFGICAVWGELTIWSNILLQVEHVYSMLTLILLSHTLLFPPWQCSVQRLTALDIMKFIHTLNSIIFFDTLQQEPAKRSTQIVNITAIQDAVKIYLLVDRKSRITFTSVGHFITQWTFTIYLK